MSSKVWHAKIDGCKHMLCHGSSDPLRRPLCEACRTALYRARVIDDAQTLLFRHGKDQMVKTIEECGELIVALAKYRADGSPRSYDAVIDEIADVIIMTEQMRQLFGRVAVEERILVKLERALR
ncbi:MAG: hypothetical protein E6Q97_05080 [Desulfurellales bacterium]|nr:MAG: hypothetical protein E6Q97_05080 [Desulfurellales bacterium]